MAWNTTLIFWWKGEHACLQVCVQWIQSCKCLLIRGPVSFAALSCSTVLQHTGSTTGKKASNTSHGVWMCQRHYSASIFIIILMKRSVKVWMRQKTAHTHSSFVLSLITETDNEAFLFLFRFSCVPECPWVAFTAPWYIKTIVRPFLQVFDFTVQKPTAAL